MEHKAYPDGACGETIETIDIDSGPAETLRAALRVLDLHANEWPFQERGLRMVGAGRWGGWHTGQWLIHDPPDSILSGSLQLPSTAKMPAGHCIAQEDIIAAHALGLLHCRVILAAEWVELGDILIQLSQKWAFLLPSGYSGRRHWIGPGIACLLRGAPKTQPLKDLLAGRAAIWILPHALCDEVCHPLWTLLRHPASILSILGKHMKLGQAWCRGQSDASRHHGPPLCIHQQTVSCSRSCKQIPAGR